MTKIAFIVSYDGTDYCGWQRQNQPGQISVAQKVEEALGQLLKEDLSVQSSGRTDAGVHALNQWCHFTSQKPREFFVNKDLGWALKSFLPEDIVIKKAFFVPEHFHALHSAEKKTYRYWIWNAPVRNPLLRRHSSWQRKPLDINFLNECSKIITGTHDFKSFQSVGTDLADTVRTVLEAKWTKKSTYHLEFKITGTGFLKQMVRNCVGTMIYLHRHGQDSQEMKKILLALDRQKAHAPAEPQGLYLDQVYYPNKITREFVPLKTNSL